MNEIKLLFERLDNFAYPDNMKLVKGEIVGEAFFPGGRGLINTNDNTISDKKIMILGQDFDCETNFEISKENGKEDIVKNPTWRNLTKVLNELEISLDNCFFTNAIMGVRRGNKGTGKSPAFKHSEFISDCQKFFLYQLGIRNLRRFLFLENLQQSF